MWPFDYLPMPGEVRTNLKLVDESTRTVTEFNEPGISMNQSQLEDFLTLLKEKSEKSDYVVLSGRLPEGCEESAYQRCLKVLEGKSACWTAPGKPFCMAQGKTVSHQANLPEIEAIMKKELRTLRGLRDAALFLIEYGAQNVIISMGKYGAMLVSRKDTFFAPALMVEARSTVGAGDAMIGGVLAGLSRGESLEESFRCGVAGGTASVMSGWDAAAAPGRI